MKLNFETDGINFNNKGKPDEIATPQNICNDMSNLFDYINCNRKIWMDMYCKTGNTLESLKKHGVNKENIIAICDNKQSQMLICRKLYGKILPEIEVEIKQKSLETYKVTRRGQVYWISDYKGIVKNHYQNTYNIIKFVILKEMEKTMSLEFTPQDDFQINNIIMNPPYNNDIYLDFVTLANNIATDSVVAITPAKWQAKGGEKNEAFRRDIVPYMSDIVYYPDCCDVFKIGEPSGITYYIIGNINNTNKSINIINKCIKKDIYNNSKIRNISKGQTLNNAGNSITSRLKHNKIFSIESNNKVGRYQVWTNNKPALSIDAVEYKRYLFGFNGQIQVLALSRLVDSKSKEEVKSVPDDCKLTFASDSIEECESFLSWAYCKLTRFLLSLSLNGITGIAAADTWWRFVPDPGNFDHIFTDVELYQKYGLTPDEIAIIESVIKERK